MEANKQIVPGLTLKMRDNIVCREIDNMYAILDLKTGAFYTLNETASLFWKLIKEQKKIDDVCAYITQQYDISHSEVMRDINTFIDFFDKEQLLIHK